MKRVTAPYPSPPATANIARFCTIVVAEEDPLLLRFLLDSRLHLLLIMDDGDGDLGHIILDDIIAIDLVVVERATDIKGIAEDSTSSYNIIGKNDLMYE